ncbi:MAG: tetratricopeptide repeat protein [Chitinophagaceae bacterium]
MYRFILFSLTLFVLLACNNTTSEKKSSTIEQKLAELNKLVKQLPDSVSLRENLVDVLDSMHDYKKAIKEIDFLIKTDSLNNAYWFRKAQLEEHIGDTGNAIINYSRSIKVYPSPEALLGLANLYAETKNALVLSICKDIRSLKLGSIYDSYAAFYEAVYWEKKQQTAKALRLLDSSISLHFKMMDAYMEKAYIYYDIKQYEKATSILKTALTVNPAYADAYYWLGKIAVQQNEAAAAKNYFQKTLSLDPSFKEAALALQALPK